MKPKTKILFIDDNASTLKIIGKILTYRGYEVQTGISAVDILTIVKSFQPDMILIDHYMPDITGKEAIKLLKADELTKNIPVIFFSTFESLDVLAKETGADAFVSKDSPVEYLTDSIAALEKLNAKVKES